MKMAWRFDKGCDCKGVIMMVAMMKMMMMMMTACQPAFLTAPV